MGHEGRVVQQRESEQGGAVPRAPQLDHALFAARRQQPQLLVVDERVDSGGLRLEGSHELASLQVEPVYFGGGAGGEQLGGVRVVGEVAAGAGDARFVVEAVLRVQLDVAVLAEHGQLGVIVAQRHQLHGGRVGASLALETQLGGLEDLERGRVGADGVDVAPVAGGLEALRVARELEVLDQLDAVAVVLQLLELGPTVLRLLQELQHRLARRQVVHLHALHLGHSHLFINE